MEKFSAYRDPGTGIQPFLTPVPPKSDSLGTLLLPLRYIVGVIRTAFVLCLLIIYILLVHGLCACFKPLPWLHRPLSQILTCVIGRTALFLLGLYWIPVEYVSRKRRRGEATEWAWKPGAGDIIVSNWVSWLELVWLAVRFNPIFVVPVPGHDAPQAARPPTAKVQKGNTAKHAPDTSQNRRIQIVGVRKVSLLSMILMTGHTPSHAKTYASLDDLRRKADRPIVVFPECTTSNGRGLLQFANLFHQDIPVKGYQVFLICVRYESPSTLAPSATHCIPSSIFNPLPHLFKLATALKPLTLQIRVLVSPESPSSPLFLTSEVISGDVDDQLAEASVVLISQLGKLKRTNVGWEDKAAFLEFYHTKSK